MLVQKAKTSTLVHHCATKLQLTEWFKTLISYIGGNVAWYHAKFGRGQLSS